MHDNRNPRGRWVNCSSRPADLSSYPLTASRPPVDYSENLRLTDRLGELDETLRAHDAEERAMDATGYLGLFGESGLAFSDAEWVDHATGTCRPILPL